MKNLMIAMMMVAGACFAADPAKPASAKEKKYVDPNEFATKGRATPFTGMKLCGVNYLTVQNGKIVYQK